MNRFLELDSFIKRANEEMKKFIGPSSVSEKTRLYMLEYNQRNREKLRRMMREYEKTDKGKKARKKVTCTRSSRFKYLSKGLTKQEINELRKFYLDCPSGYHVDHIFPISKGGKHILWNLQFLTKEQNSIKFCTIPCHLEKFEKSPYCPYPR